MLIDVVLGKAGGRGGLETVITAVCNELVTRGYRVRVFQQAPPEYPDWIETLPENYYYDPEIMELEPTLWQEKSPVEQMAFGYSTLLHVLGKPDIVLATHTPALSYVCWTTFQGQIEKPPIISWLHGPPNAYGGSGIQIKLADAHIAISTTIGKKISELTTTSPIFYVGNPLPTSHARVMKRSVNPLKLLYMGRLSNEQKRMDLLFQALCRLDGEWNLTIVGDGPDFEIFKKLAFALGIEKNVIWMGWQLDPWECLEEASLLMLTSDYEGFGMVLTEALSRGIPVLSTDTDGPGDIIIQGKNGWLVPIGDYIAIRKILQQIIDGELELPDPESCQRITTLFSLEKVVDRFEDTFHTVLKHTESSNQANQSLKMTLHKLLRETSLIEQAQTSDTFLSDQDPSNLDVNKKRLTAWIDSGQLHLADRFLRKYIEKMDVDVELISIAAFLYNAEGYFEKAVESLLDAYHVDPTYVDNLFSLAVMHDQANDKERALFFYWQILFFCTEKNVVDEIRAHIQSLTLRINQS